VNSSTIFPASPAGHLSCLFLSFFLFPPAFGYRSRQDSFFEFLFFLIWSEETDTNDHLLLDSALNLGPLITRWGINKFKNCWCKSVKILKQGHGVQLQNPCL
jgi:hypothetical protein